MIRIYNTLSKAKEEFKPINPPNVNMYICGPTVYDFIHIGNARTFIMADIIRRYLEFRGFNVKYVMNLTDIDDRIIKKSIGEKIDSSAVAAKYASAFLEDVSKLKIEKATVYPRATEHIDVIINMIKSLVERGFAYEVDGNVFYNVTKFNGYGRLSGKKLDELEAGARVEVNEEKKDPLDFSLWKKAKEGEPYWESPWGKGRPGWHIECSAMSCKHLGDNFDIHAGGNDLIFPHHENEIAQSEAANGKKFVNYWMHFGFLNINEEKMSKSLGNFFTAREVLGKYSAEAIRLFFAQAHYGGPLNFSEELLAGAQKGLEKLSNIREKISTGISSADPLGINIDFNLPAFENEFTNAMDDDFNSPKAIAVIFDFVREVNKAIDENDNLSKSFYQSAADFLSKTADGILGIIPPLAAGKIELNNEVINNLTAFAREIDSEEFKNIPESSPENLINFLIEERLKARKNKNFPLSDKIRDFMKNNGIVLQDLKDKTTFKILSK